MKNLRSVTNWVISDGRRWAALWWLGMGSVSASVVAALNESWVLASVLAAGAALAIWGVYGLALPGSVLSYRLKVARCMRRWDWDVRTLDEAAWESSVKGALERSQARLGRLRPPQELQSEHQRLLSAWSRLTTQRGELVRAASQGDDSTGSSDERAWQEVLDALDAVYLEDPPADGARAERSESQ